MALFSHHSHSHDIQRDIQALRRDIAALSRSASKRGANAWHGATNEASGFYDEVSQRVSQALPVVRQRAHDLEDTIRDNPGRSIALAGFAALTLAATLFLLGNSRR